MTAEPLPFFKAPPPPGKAAYTLGRGHIARLRRLSLTVDESAAVRRLEYAQGTERDVETVIAVYERRSWQQLAQLLTDQLAEWRGSR